MAAYFKIFWISVLSYVHFGFGFTVPFFPLLHNADNSNYGYRPTVGNPKPILVHNSNISSTTSKPAESNTEPVIFVPVIEMVPETEHFYANFPPPISVPVPYAYGENNVQFPSVLDDYQEYFQQQNPQNVGYFNYFSPIQPAAHLEAASNIGYYPFMQQVEVKPVPYLQQSNIHETTNPVIIDSEFKIYDENDIKNDEMGTHVVQDTVEQQKNFILETIKKIVEKFAASNNTNLDDLHLDFLPYQIVDVTTESVLPASTPEVFHDIENSTDSKDFKNEVGANEIESEKLKPEVVTEANKTIEVASTTQVAPVVYPPQPFIDQEGNPCWRETVETPDHKTYYVFTCEQKSIMRITTKKSDIEQFTNELSSVAPVDENESVTGNHGGDSKNLTTENPTLPQVLNDFVFFNLR